MNQYQKMKAATRTYREALRKGVMSKSRECSHCGVAEGSKAPTGKTVRIHGHHADYDKPLDVKWLCASCHKKEPHAKNTKGAPGNVNARVPVGLWDAVRARALQQGLKLEFVVKEALESWLKRRGK